LGHGLEMKTYDAPENDKQIPHSSVHEALQVTRNKKENGIGRNRELAQGDAQWSRSTLVSSPSRRQAKCSQTEMPSMISKIPTACHPMTVCLLYDLVLVLVDSITTIIMANHPMVRATQQSLSLSDYIYFQGSPGDFYSHAVSNTLARPIVPLKP